MALDIRTLAELPTLPVSADGTIQDNDLLEFSHYNSTEIASEGGTVETAEWYSSNKCSYGVLKNSFAQEYASKIDFNTVSSSLSSGISSISASLKPMAFMNYQLVASLPSNPDPNTFYFLTAE